MTLREAEKALSDAGIEDARDEARILFEKVGGIERYKLVSPSVNCDSEKLAAAIARRVCREPLGYVIGEVDFYRESYVVTENCLIPRSDTETLVDLAVSMIPKGELFYDLCTGSGCVAISTLKNTVDTRAIGVDISEAALELARKNAEKNRVSDRLTLRLVDLFHDTLDGPRPYAILANPPYVSEEVYPMLEREIFFEPKIAFTSGKDGGDLIRVLIPLCKRFVKPEGFFAFEIGYDQADMMRELAAENGVSVEIKKDLAGRDRVALFRATRIH